MCTTTTLCVRKFVCVFVDAFSCTIFAFTSAWFLARMAHMAHETVRRVAFLSSFDCFFLYYIQPMRGRRGENQNKTAIAIANYVCCTTQNAQTHKPADLMNESCAPILILILYTSNELVAGVVWQSNVILLIHCVLYTTRKQQHVLSVSKTESCAQTQKKKLLTLSQN